jgi:hypothetical protein
VARTADGAVPPPARGELAPAAAAIAPTAVVAAAPSEPVRQAPEPQVWRRHEEPRESDGPLPTRRRGTALSDLQRWPAEDDNPHQPEGAQGEIVAAEQHSRPPLPKRRDQATHLPPQLLQLPVMTRPIPGHDTGLLADLQQGRDEGLADRLTDTGRFRAIGRDPGEPGVPHGDGDAEQHLPPH